MQGSKRRNIVIFKAVFAFVFILVGSIFAFLVPGIITAKQERCTMEVSAVVVDLKETDGDNGTLYSPVYEIVLDGKTETRSNNTYSSIYPEIGEETTIFLNPDNTQEYYAPDGALDILVTVFRVIGIVLLVIAVIFIFLPIH